MKLVLKTPDQPTEITWYSKYTYAFTNSRRSSLRSTLMPTLVTKTFDLVQKCGRITEIGTEARQRAATGIWSLECVLHAVIRQFRARLYKTTKYCTFLSSVRWKTTVQLYSFTVLLINLFNTNKAFHSPSAVSSITKVSSKTLDLQS
jgi:hypothetical protein